MEGLFGTAMDNDSSFKTAYGYFVIFAMDCRYMVIIEGFRSTFGWVICSKKINTNSFVGMLGINMI